MFRTTMFTIGALLTVVVMATASSFPSSTITISQPTYFTATDGTNLVVQPGTYKVEGTDNELHLIPKGDAAPILLSAQQTPFPEDVDVPIAMSIPIEKEGLYIAWLQAGEKGVEAIGSYSPVQKRGIALFKIHGKLTSRHIRQLKSFAKRLAKDPDSKTLKNDWTRVVKGITRQKALRNAYNVHAMVMMVLRASIVEQHKDKQYWLRKLQTYNAMGKELSQYLEDLRKKAQSLKGAKKAQNTQRIHRKENERQTLGNDAQLANVDLQNILQKQRQLLQMMSNISKMLHDTAMAVIRKIGG